MKLLDDIYNLIKNYDKLSIKTIADLLLGVLSYDRIRKRILILFLILLIKFPFNILFCSFLFLIVILKYTPDPKKAFKIKFPSSINEKNIKNTKINIIYTKKDCNEFKKYKKDINNLKTQYQSKEEIAKKNNSTTLPTTAINL